jgi:hypothetical protein
MTLYREVFGATVKFTAPGETYVDKKDGLTKEGRSGITLLTTRGEVTLTALQFLAISALSKSDSEAIDVIHKMVDKEKESLKGFLK